MLRRYDQSPHLKLDNLPFPRRDLYKTGLVNVAETIEATRGCIFQCEFCVVPAAWGKRLYKSPSPMSSRTYARWARSARFFSTST